MNVELVSPDQLERLLAAEAQLGEGPDTLYNSPFLRLLVSIQREKLSDSFSERHCQAGEVICWEGEPGDTMYLVWSGRVVIFKGSLDAPAILSYKGAGEIIGEMALLENQPRSATIVALDPVRLLGLNRQRFQLLLQENPSVSFSIMEMLSARLRRASERVKQASDGENGSQSERQLQSQLDTLQNEKQRLEDLNRLHQETSELIIHDLRNPLSSIAIALRMITLVLPDEILQANREILDIARVSCDRMQRLVDSLLEVSRMESGETQYLWSQVDLTKLVGEVLESVSFIDRKQIHLEASFPGSESGRLPPIIADRDKIERVLVNLLDNALKFSPDNSRVTIKGEMDDGGVRLSVSDQGPGVSPEEQEYIFERFAQSGDHKGRRGGFGLGLAYCKLAVEGHGGKIWVEPNPGGGSRFVLTLPMLPTRPAGN